MADTFKKDLHKLATEITKREGKKSSVKRGDVLEILRVIAELDCEAFILNRAGEDGKIQPMAVLHEYSDRLFKEKMKTLVK